MRYTLTRIRQGYMGKDVPTLQWEFLRKLFACTFPLNVITLKPYFSVEYKYSTTTFP